MRSLKVAGLTAVSHFSKLLATLLTIKLIAVAAGPEGLGFLGNYMSLISIATALAGGGVITGVVKYLSEFSLDSERQKIFTGSALIYSVTFSVLALLLGWPFVDYISLKVFGSTDNGIYISFFLIAQVLAAINNLAYGILNGLKENGTYALIVVVSNFITIVLAYYFIVNHQMTGAVLAVTLPLMVPLLPVSLFFFWKRNFLIISLAHVLADCRSLSRYSLMLIVSAACFPLVEIIVRTNINIAVGGDAVGIWQALIRLSSAYLSFFSVFLSFYLVPKLSGENDRDTIFRSVCMTMLFLSGIFFIMFTFVSLAKDELIVFIFSKSFLQAGDYLLIQMAGDYFRIMGWVVGFVVVARAATKLYILGELFQGVVFALLTHFTLTNFPKLEGVTYAYLITCFAYFLITIAGLAIFLNKKPSWTSPT